MRARDIAIWFLEFLHVVIHSIIFIPARLIAVMFLL